MINRRGHSGRFRAALVWLSLALPFATAARAQNYVIQDLGTLGGTQSGALAIDSRGVVAGLASVAGSNLFHAFVYDGQMLDLGTLGGPQSGARAINRFDEVVGWSHLADGTQHAFLHKGGVMTGLGTFGGFSDARGINDAREIVGSSARLPGNNERAFVWRGDGLIDLGTLGGTESRAYAINEQGDICGFAQITSGDLRPFLHRDGVMIDLGSLGGWAGHAYALNETGKVVGWSMMIPNSVSHAFLWSEGALIDLGTLGGAYSAAFGINNSGAIVGASTRADGVQAAFVWNGIKVVDLNTRIPAESGWFLSSASGINDDGRIVGIGRYQGAAHAYRLTPEGYLDTEPQRPAALRLLGAAPNPMLAWARIRFELPEAAHVTLGVYDVGGRRVRVLADRPLSAGALDVVWDGRDDTGARVRAGVYWVRMDALARTLTSRVAVLR
jgi:probable HAF family extracellular repeat protein